MAASPGEKKLVELLLESRELCDEVVAAVEGLLGDETVTVEEGRALIEALLKAPELAGEWRVGGIIKS